MEIETEPEIVVERHGGVLVATLNRPAARNALTPASIAGLCRAYDELEADDALRVGVLTGAGADFCAGMDLKVFADGGFTAADETAFGRLVESPPPKPLIAAIEGNAVAGGWELAMACDLVVASTGARLAMPEVLRAIVPTGGALLRLPRRMPYQLAMELALTGTAIDGTTALGHGLVNRLCSPGRALELALELAQEIAGRAPLATADITRIVRAAGETLGPDLWRWQREVGRRSHASADALEGARAFAEKRPPVWRGR
jgi:enoyl-CoA hydratase